MINGVFWEGVSRRALALRFDIPRWEVDRRISKGIMHLRVALWDDFA